MINITKLKQHEKIITKHFTELKDQISKNRYIVPIIVDSKNLIILDGHHRYNVMRELGYDKIPVFLVDYDSENIKVESWKKDKKVTKEDVIKRGISGNLFPPKTSRHVLSNPEQIKVSLGELA